MAGDSAYFSRRADAELQEDFWKPKAHEAVPDFGTREYLKKFGPPDSEQLAAYAAHMSVC